MVNNSQIFKNSEVSVWFECRKERAVLFKEGPGQEPPLENASWRIQDVS